MVEGGMEQRPEAGGVDRRAFLRGAMGGAALGAAGALGLLGLRQAARDAEAELARRVRYIGMHVLPGSPARRGLPLIITRVQADGTVKGHTRSAVEDLMPWYRYCGTEYRQAVFETPSDDVFRYDLPPEITELHGMELGERYWYADRLGAKVEAEHFADLPYGMGARVRWRAEDLPRDQSIPALVMKLDPARVTGDAAASAEDFIDPEHHLMGVVNLCTHFCCEAGYKESPAAEKLGFWDQVFCACHNARWDPLRWEPYTFDLRPGPG